MSAQQMTAREAVLHLRARANVQRTQKTSYNRLRWTKADLDAVDALLDLLMKAGETRRREEAQGMAKLPEPDPQEGATAESEAAQARRDVLRELEQGELTLTGLFDMAYQEHLDKGHHVIGHLHLRAALLALPWIGDKAVIEILEEVGLDPSGSEHIAQLGSDQQQRLIEAVTARQGSHS